MIQNKTTSKQKRLFLCFFSLLFLFILLSKVTAHRSKKTSIQWTLTHK